MKSLLLISFLSIGIINSLFCQEQKSNLKIENYYFNLGLCYPVSGLLGSDFSAIVESKKNHGLRASYSLFYFKGPVEPTDYIPPLFSFNEPKKRIHSISLNYRKSKAIDLYKLKPSIEFGLSYQHIISPFYIRNIATGWGNVNYDLESKRESTFGVKLRANIEFLRRKYAGLSLGVSADILREMTYTGIHIGYLFGKVK